MASTGRRRKGGGLDGHGPAGIAEMARAGARVIVDDVFHGGAQSQQRWRNGLGTLRVLWADGP